MKLTLLIFVLTLLPATAVGQTNEERYAEYYGDGMRAYTEARYEEALEHLYRAFAAKQNPYPLKLIIRAHDFQGNCSARERAAAMLQDLFPAKSIPPPQRCYRTGTLDLRCPHDVRKARIDDSFDVACGSATQLPVGRHHVRAGDIALNVEVAAERSTVASLDGGRSRVDIQTRKRARRGPSRPLLRQDLGDDPDMPASFRFRSD